MCLRFKVRLNAHFPFFGLSYHAHAYFSQTFDYQVDRLFESSATTEEIYEKAVVDLIPFAWNGGIGTLFAYGQTGSGKTFTVSRIQELIAASLVEKEESTFR